MRCETASRPPSRRCPGANPRLAAPAEGALAARLSSSANSVSVGSSPDAVEARDSARERNCEVFCPVIGGTPFLNDGSLSIILAGGPGALDVGHEQMAALDPKSDPDPEQRVLAACQDQRFELATEHALHAYGGELYGFLQARLHASADADEVFSMVTEDLWRGLQGFAWRCSLRTWLYTLARSAISRYALAPQTRVRRHETPTQLEALVARTRSATNVYQQTAVKDRFRLLREQLDDDDQTLLILRVDRNLAWRDLAVAFSDDSELDEAALDREAARLRKAFERVKRTLREMARREGLLESDS